MNSNLLEANRKMCLENIAEYQFALRILETLGDRLSDECRISPGGSLWIYPKNRNDMAALMTLAPRWSKSHESDRITYYADVDGITIWLKAEGDALPGTCRLVEEEYEVPAEPEKIIPAKPASKAKRMVLRCDNAPEPVTSVAQPDF